MTDETNREWFHAGPADAIRAAGKKLFRLGGRQILVLHHHGNFFACNNRCPHQGYPLSEGTLSGSCQLTCNWHNWKFDLRDGTVLDGGDRLRIYPTRMEGSELYIDISPLSPAARRTQAFDNLRDAMLDFQNQRDDYSRIARELARLEQAGAAAEDIVAYALTLVADRLEYGFMHAHAMIPDWLQIRAAFSSGPQHLVPLVEIVHYLASNCQSAKLFPYADIVLPYDAQRLLEAIEQEDEDQAVGLIRGALAEGRSFDDLEPVLAEAALSHYSDFGHSVIYLVKTGEILRWLGNRIDPAHLLLPLIRSLISATREDLIPEFRYYHTARQAWTGQGAKPVHDQDFFDLPVKAALIRVNESSHDLPGLYAALLNAAGWNLLQFDFNRDQNVQVPVADDVDWLEVTHAITFANAGRILATKYPSLWPDFLLQMACWTGRNIGFRAPKPIDPANKDIGADLWTGVYADLIDHSEDRPVLAAHLVKTSLAVKAEIDAAPQACYVPALQAGLIRFLDHPVRFHKPLRAAWQALDFIQHEG